MCLRKEVRKKFKEEEERIKLVGRKDTHNSRLKQVEENLSLKQYRKVKQIY